VEDSKPGRLRPDEQAHDPHKTLALLIGVHARQQGVFT
jgi:hypothetical protein